MTQNKEDGGHFAHPGQKSLGSIKDELERQIETVRAVKAAAAHETRIDRTTLLGSTATTNASFKTWNFTNKDTGEAFGPAPVSSYARVMVDEAKRRHAAEARPRASGDPVTFAKGEAIKKEFAAWLLGELRLEKVHHSVAHKILPTDLPVESHVLIVNHDWARLLKDADTSGPAARGGGVRLPYPITAFEFFFHGGVHAVAIAMQRPSSPEGDPYDIQTSTHFKIKSGWLKAKIEIEYDEFGKLVNPDQIDSDNPLMKVYDLITANIFAISAMLEAEVAEATHIREAYKRNRERPVRKELPGMSHHVVSLVRRPRTQRSDFPGEDRRSPRLHFRRGHWRHFASHRTWIKWQLVGDPDLGWVEKEYAL